MARTVTTLVNAVSIAASTGAVSTSATATALASDTYTFTLFGKIKGAGQMQPNANVRVYYKCLPYDSTDGIREQAIQGASFIDLKWNPYPNQYTVTTSGLQTATGGYLHWWYETPSLPFGATLTVTLVQQPSFDFSQSSLTGLALTLTAGTASTSSTTGTLIVTGGVGISGSLFCGAGSTIGTTVNSGNGGGGLACYGNGGYGPGITLSLGTSAGNFYIISGASSNTNPSGALAGSYTGKLCIGRDDRSLVLIDQSGNMQIQGTARLYDSTEATAGGAGSFITPGGIYATKKIFSGSDIASGGSLSCSASISTGAPNSGSSGTWKLGQYSAGVLVQAGSVRVNIDGTDYDFLTA